MKKKAVFLALALMLVFAAGCTQCNSFLDGMTGRPVDQAGYQDLPEWYHAGQLTLPVLSTLAAFVRSAILPFLGIVL